MILWKKLPLVLSILLFIPFSLRAQNTDQTISPGDSFGDNVQFDNPEGYVDRQFKELAQEYIQPKVPYDLDVILGKERKLTPETLQRLVDMLADQVSQKIEKRLSRSNLETSRPKQTSRQVTKDEIRSYIEDLSSLEKEEVITPPRKRLSIQVAEPLSRATTLSPREISTIRPGEKASILKFELGSVVRNSRINLNQASHPQTAEFIVSRDPKVNRIQIDLLAKNIKTNKDYPVASKNFLSLPNRSSYPLKLSWDMKTQPTGNYKILVRARFFDSQGRLTRTQTQFWGNSSSSRFLVIRN